MKFLECHYSLKLHQELEFIGQDGEDNPGSLVHKMFAEGREPDSTTDGLVKLYYNKLSVLRGQLNFLPALESREVREEFDLEFPHVKVHVTRILDDKGSVFNGRDENDFVAIDYKTAGKKWPTVVLPNGYEDAPQAHTFQAEAYVYPRPDKAPSESPGKIYFLVAPIRDRAVYYAHNRTPEGMLNLLHAMEYAAMSYLAGDDGPCSIINRGRACDWCNYQQMCWKSPGWEELYQKRER